MNNIAIYYSPYYRIFINKTIYKMNKEGILETLIISDKNIEILKEKINNVIKWTGSNLYNLKYSGINEAKQIVKESKKYYQKI